MIVASYFEIYSLNLVHLVSTQPRPVGQLQREGPEGEAGVQRRRRCRPRRRRRGGGRGRRRGREQLGMEGDISMLPQRRDTQSGHFNTFYLGLYSAD